MHKYILQDKLFELFYPFIDQKWKKKLKIDEKKNNKYSLIQMNIDLNKNHDYYFYYYTIMIWNIENFQHLINIFIWKYYKIMA